MEQSYCRQARSHRGNEGNSYSGPKASATGNVKPKAFGAATQRSASNHQSVANKLCDHSDESRSLQGLPSYLRASKGSVYVNEIIDGSI